MEANELIERLERDNIGDALLLKCFSMLASASPKMAYQFLECVEGMSVYNNYMSETEAEGIANKFVNADGSEGARWTPETLFDKLEGMELETESVPEFNRWALWLTVNMEHSDHTSVLQKWSEGDPDKYVEACYDLAVSQLSDKDRPHWIREYFHL